MSTPHGNLIADLKRWRIPYDRNGSTFTAYLPDVELSWDANGRNASIRGVHRQISDRTGRTATMHGQTRQAARVSTQRQRERDAATARTARSTATQRAVLAEAKSESTITYEQMAGRLLETHDARVGIYVLTKHALARMLEHRITAAEVREAIAAPLSTQAAGDGTERITGPRCTVVVDLARACIITAVP